MRVAVYVQAPPGQQAHPTLGPSEQRRRIERYAAEQGWDLVEVFEEPPEGGAARPALERLTEHLEGIDKVVLVQFDRLRRSLTAAFELIARLRNAGVDLVCIEEGFDTGADTGKAVLDVLRVLSRWQTIAEARAGWLPENLRRAGFAPATLIDVGVGPGTASLYGAFPDSHLVLIEPLEEFLPQLEGLIAARSGEYVLAAIGDHDGTTEIKVDQDSLIASSILPSLQGLDHTRVGRTVPMRTLDSLMRERQWRGPFGLKVDSEGFEHHVINGATSLLEDTHFVLAEVSVGPRFEDSYTFAEFIALMDERGFALCDILHVARARRDRDAHYVDGLFRRKE